MRLAVATAGIALATAGGIAVATNRWALAVVIGAAAAVVAIGVVTDAVEALLIVLAIGLPVYGTAWASLRSNVGLLTLLSIALVLALLPHVPDLVAVARHAWILVPLLGFGVVVAASLALATRTPTSTHLVKVYAGRAVLLPLAVAGGLVAIGSPRARDVLIRTRTAFAVVAIGGAVVSLIQVAYGRGYLVDATPANAYADAFIGIRAMGFAEAPGTWGAFLVIPFGMCLVAWLLERNVLAGIATIAALLGIILSGLRSAWLAAAIASAVAVVAARAPFARTFVFAGAAVVTAVLSLQIGGFRTFLGGGGSTASTSTGPATATTITKTGKTSGVSPPRHRIPPPSPDIGRGRLRVDESAHTRLLLTRAELDLGRRNPLTGVGLGNIGFALGRTRPAYIVNDPTSGIPVGGVIEKHNTYAGLFAELGLPGAAAFVATMIAGVIALLRVRRDPEERPLADGLLTALAATVVVAAFTDADRQVFIWWILGCAFGLDLCRRPEVRRAVDVDRRVASVSRN